MNLSKNFFKDIKFVGIGFILILASVLFLLAGPQTFQLVESKVSSENLPNILPNIDNKTPEKTDEPKVELISANLPAPNLSAVAVIAYDTDLAKVIYEKNSHAHLAPASTTKIMTAIIASEYFNSGDLLTVPPQAIVGGSSMGLSAGEQLTFRSLLYGMMLNSGNDAAYTLAYNYPGGFDSFISQMNKKAQQIGAVDTHFDNPAGFDSPTHYTSAYDLLLIGKEALKNAKLGTVYSTKETSVTSVDKTHVHALKNLNKLLDIEGFLGMKTGTTELAGESLVGLLEKDNRTILTVMLNSQDRFGETKSLLDWVFKNYTWKVN